ncbi:Hypothetical protein GSB_5927 [Giardia duodenalis]|uniref:t-SNARE coiled-coil homology domain-containing protein n=2 Tax=Giardia intestinalis TaxID=5741 RepID=V6TWS9_GIAIN|nr:Hypothetical protein GSB_5927 [Giardia intestinalis]
MQCLQEQNRIKKWMYSVRERLLRIYEEAAGEPYQSSVKDLQEQDAGIEQKEADIIENLRIISQLHINELRKSLEERDAMIKKNPSNTKIPFLSQEIREKIRGLKENVDQFRDLEKKCERELSKGSEDARALAQKNCQECREMATLIDDYCKAFTEEERERAFQQTDMGSPMMPSAPLFGNTGAKMSKIDELLPVHENAEEARDKLASMEQEFNEDLKILMSAVNRAKAQTNQIEEKLNQIGEVIEVVDEKMETAVTDIKNLHKSTADVRKKVASVGKCIWITIIVILLAIVGIWIYRIVSNFM